MKYDDIICGIINIETSSTEKANKQANIMKECPKCLAIGTTGNKITGVYLVPRENKWWINYAELFPEQNAQVLMIENVNHPDILTIELAEKPPCGAVCDGCPFIEKYGCQGCIAIRVYNKKSNKPTHTGRLNNSIDRASNIL